MQKSALMLNQYTHKFLCKATFSSLSISISSVFFKLKARKKQFSAKDKLSQLRKQGASNILKTSENPIPSLEKNCILRQRKKTIRHRTFDFEIGNSQVWGKTERTCK